MTQKLSPLYGDFLNDTYVASAASHRPGFLIQPAISESVGAGPVATITLGPDTDLGFWAWKTRWMKDQGAFTFIEDAPIVVVSANTSSHPYQLLVARWKWTTGLLDVDGHPVGAYEAGMHPVYQFEDGVAGDMVDDLIKTSIAQPDSNGRYGVVLGVLNGILFTPMPATMLDLAKLATQNLPISLYAKSTAQAPPGSQARVGFSGGTFHSTGDAPTQDGNGDWVIKRDGFYNIDFQQFINQTSGIFGSMTLLVNGASVGSWNSSGGITALMSVIWGGAMKAGDVVSFQFIWNYATTTTIRITRA